MQKDKIEAYIGFSIKSNSAVYGKDNLFSRRTKIYLILMCGSAAENTKKDVLAIAGRLKAGVILTKAPLSGLTHKENCKVMGITDKNLAGAILKNLNENYSLLA